MTIPRPADGLVVSLVVVDGLVSHSPIADSSRVLVVVRDPRTNDTHPNVVSVPTTRLPAAFFDSLWPANVRAVCHGSTALVPWQPWRRPGPGSRDPVTHVVDAVMARKLGLADPLELGAVAYEAGVHAATVGWSRYAERVPSSEQLTMICVLVGLGAGADLLPARTASYSDVRWVSVLDFMESVQRADPARLGLDPVEFCIHGLCIASTYDILAAARTREVGLEEAVRDCQGLAS